MTAYGILVVHASPLRLKEDAAGLVDELRRAISIGRLHGPAPGVVARAVS
jgi:hypothetical protein